MKILVADKISPKGVAYLRAQKGFEVVEAYGSSPAKVLELVKDVHAIAVRSETKITAEVIAAAPLLKVVGRAGVGVDNVDVEAATERGVIVMNTPSGNTVATAELTFTHILCGARPVPQAAASMREGKWDRKSFSGIELFKKTLGIVGLGRIGTEVAKRAQAFGMTVLAYDPYLKEHPIAQLVSLDDLVAKADVISLHLPLTDETRGMVNAAFIAQLKDGVILINTGRGKCVVDADVAAALTSGKLRAYGTDVWPSDPPPADCPLLTAPNVFMAPHIGASSKENLGRIGDEVVLILQDFKA